MGLSLVMSEKKPVWVEYELFDDNGNKIAEAEFLVKSLSVSEVNKITKACTVREKKALVEKGKKRYEIVEDIDNVEFLQRMFDAACVDWKGLDDENGNPIECNSENKRFIANNYPDIANFCIEESRNIEQLLQAQKEEQVKN